MDNDNIRFEALDDEALDKVAGGTSNGGSCCCECGQGGVTLWMGQRYFPDVDLWGSIYSICDACIRKNHPEPEWSWKHI